MKTALFCVAKDEDRYIDEWIRYHLQLGFDEIYVSCDRWIPKMMGNDYSTRVHWLLNTIKPPVQVQTYHQALGILGPLFDFIAFFDVDEFLVLKKHANVHDFLADKQTSVGINWVLFGDSGLQDTGELGVLKRLTMRQTGVNPHVKCIVKTDPGVEIWHPHFPNAEWIGSDGLLHTGPLCENGNDEVAQLNHYFGKTIEEWQVKRDRGRADDGEARPDSDFMRHNLNEIEDLWAKNFLYGEK